MATTTRSGGILRAKRRPRPAFTVPFAQFRRNYAVRRIGKALFTIWLVTTLTFFVIRLLPGSPIDLYISQQMGEYGISYGEAAAAASALYSIDPRESKVTQYLSFLGRWCKGTSASP